MGTNVHDDTMLKWLETERGREHSLRRIGYAAWMVTFVALLVFAVKVLANTAFVWSRVSQDDLGLRGISIVLDTLGPLVTVVGVTGLLIAVLSTVGVFLRTRAASMMEIQLRLAALERVLAAPPDEGS